MIAYSMLKINYDMCRLPSEMAELQVKVESLTEQLTNKDRGLHAIKIKVLSNHPAENDLHCLATAEYLLFQVTFMRLYNEEVLIILKLEN